MTEHPHRQSRK